MNSHEHGIVGEHLDEAGLGKGIKGVLDDVDDPVVGLDVRGDDLLSVGGDHPGVEIAPVQDGPTECYSGNGSILYVP